MDAVMKILKEIERQSQPAQPLEPPPDNRKQRRAAAAQAQQESMDQAQAESAQNDDWQIPQDAAPRAGWNRQRIVDALQFTMIIGPPPGLAEDDD